MRDMGSEKNGGIPRLSRSPAALRRMDASDWREGIAFNSFGVRIGIRTTQVGLCPVLQRLLPPASKPSSPIVDRLFSLTTHRDVDRRIEHTLYRGARKLASLDEIDPLLKLLEMDIRRVVASSSPSKVFVHAGVVGWRGRAIVLPGYSMSGKSTLVAELVKLGATYYSDEFAVLDEAGYVHPFAKPLSLRKAASFEAEEREIESLGGRKGNKAIPVGVIALARYIPDRRWQPHILSRGRGLLGLLSHSIATRLDPSRVTRTLGQAVDQAVIVRSERGEASEAATALISMINDSGRILRSHPSRSVFDFGEVIRCAAQTC